MKTIKWTIPALLVIEATAVTASVIILGKYFNFPDILREPATTAFTMFRDNQGEIILGYYIFLLSALLYIPLSYQFWQIHQFEKPMLAQSLIGLGVTTAVFQAIGFVRWIFTMPLLTDLYFERPEDQKMLSILYETLNRYAGMSIGEHLGFLSMGAWTLILAGLIRGSQLIDKILSSAGIFIGSLILVSVGEHFGGERASFFGTLNFLSNTLWTFWILILAGTHILQQDAHLPKVAVKPS